MNGATALAVLAVWVVAAVVLFVGVRLLMRSHNRKMAAMWAKHYEDVRAIYRKYGGA